MHMQGCLLACTFLCVLFASSIAWWPFSSSTSEETDTEQGRYLKNSPVPFEMTTAEEKFLAEAKKYMGNLTPLDTCHQIVSNEIIKIFWKVFDFADHRQGPLHRRFLSLNSMQFLSR